MLRDRLTLLFTIQRRLLSRRVRFGIHKIRISARKVSWELTQEEVKVKAEGTKPSAFALWDVPAIIPLATKVTDVGA